MPKRKHISGLHAASAADEFARREPVKWVSSPEEEGKQVVALTAAPAIGAKKALPRLRKLVKTIRPDDPIRAANRNDREIFISICTRLLLAHVREKHPGEASHIKQRMS